MLFSYKPHHAVFTFNIDPKIEIKWKLKNDNLYQQSKKGRVT